jgi:hypothetical protein
VNCQLLVVNCQLLIVSCQLSVVSTLPFVPQLKLWVRGVATWLGVWCSSRVRAHPQLKLWVKWVLAEVAHSRLSHS